MTKKDDHRNIYISPKDLSIKNSIDITITIDYVYMYMYIMYIINAITIIIITITIIPHRHLLLRMRLCYIPTYILESLQNAFQLRCDLRGHHTHHF